MNQPQKIPQTTKKKPAKRGAQKKKSRDNNRMQKLRADTKAKGIRPHTYWLSGVQAAAMSAYIAAQGWQVHSPKAALADFAGKGKANTERPVVIVLAPVSKPSIPEKPKRKRDLSSSRASENLELFSVDCCEPLAVPNPVTESSEATAAHAEQK